MQQQANGFEISEGELVERSVTGGGGFGAAWVRSRLRVAAVG